ncbi:4Fe-4S dicluster domain-containing protein [Sulfurospirillum sp. 1307]
MNDKKRRQFIKQTTGIGILGLISGAGIYLAPSLKAKEPILRPPGAVSEEQFLKLCIKCGQCLQVCPYDAIELEDIDGGASIGMAYISPSKRGCYLCEAFPCMLACPTGALDHEHDNIKYVQMGMAVIGDINTCLAINNKKPPKSIVDRLYEHTKILSSEELESKHVNINGNESEKEKLQKDVLVKLEENKDKPCSLCASMCPYPSPLDAIEMVSYKSGSIPKIKEKCVGCGVCVEMCPVDIIKVIPRKNYEDIYNA